MVETELDSYETFVALHRLQCNGSQYAVLSQERFISLAQLARRLRQQRSLRLQLYRVTA